MVSGIYFRKQNYEEKKSKEYWKFEKRSFQKMRACADSRTCGTMRRGQLRLATARMVVPTCQTQWFLFFSGCGWLPRSSYGKDRCLRKSILVGLTDESNRRARQRVRERREKNAPGLKAGGARNFFPLGMNFWKPQLGELRLSPYSACP